jgi:uncharacterized protein (DUF2249 family)
VLAPRVTIAEAAAIGKCPQKTILDKLAGIGFEVNENESAPFIEHRNTDKPVGIDIYLAESYDVRDELSKGLDPLSNIMKKLSGIEVGKTLLVINSFEPVPLIRLLRDKGYSISLTHQPDETVYTYITKTTGSGSLADADVPEEGESDLFDTVLNRPDLKFTEIDVRALVMPQPMVTILDKVDSLQEGEALYVRHKKIPVYLLPELQERNFSYIYKNTGSEVIILIYPATLSN